jgi:hypothetical protein
MQHRRARAQIVTHQHLGRYPIRRCAYEPNPKKRSKRQGRLREAAQIIHGSLLQVWWRETMAPPLAF